MSPLLPPAGSALLITSRVRFTLPGMVTIGLAPLDGGDAVTLLRGLCARLGDADAQTLAQVCGALPLALRISGSLLHNDPALAVADYLARLADERQRLALLRDPDAPALDVAATLALSYAQLDDEAQQVFRQMGVFAADVGTTLAQAVIVAPAPADTNVDQTLRRLLRRNLVMYDPERVRWRLHDLLRDLARQHLDAAGEREITMWRYAQATLSLAQTIQAQYRAGGDQALAALMQFDAEGAHIGAAWAWGMTHAATPDGDQLLLALALATTLIGELRWDTAHERLPRLEGALGAAVRLGQRDAEGWLLLSLGWAIFDLGSIHHAITTWEQALALFHALGDRSREGGTLGNLGTAYARLGEMQRAIAAYEQALEIFRDLGDLRQQGHALGNLGHAYADLGAVPSPVPTWSRPWSARAVSGTCASPAWSCTRWATSPVP